MSERKIEALERLFHEKAVFVHMGGTMSRAQELEVIRSGLIQYKKADVQESSARVIGTTAIVLNSIRLGITSGCVPPTRHLLRVFVDDFRPPFS